MIWRCKDAVHYLLGAWPHAVVNIAAAVYQVCNLPGTVVWAPAPTQGADHLAPGQAKKGCLWLHGVNIMQITPADSLYFTAA